MSCLDPIDLTDPVEDGSPVSSGVISPAQPQAKQARNLEQQPRRRAHMVFSQASSSRALAMWPLALWLDDWTNAAVWDHV